MGHIDFYLRNKIKKYIEKYHLKIHEDKFIFCLYQMKIQYAIYDFTNFSILKLLS